MAGYSHTTWGQLKAILAKRLGDSSMTFWTDAELAIYLTEALRTFGVLSAFWRERGKVDLVGPNAFYDLAFTLSNNVLTSTVTDMDIIKQIQYMLLESPSTQSSWPGTSQFSYSDIVSAVTQYRNQFLADTGIMCTHSVIPYTGAPDGRQDLDQQVIDVRRAVWTWGIPVAAVVPMSILACPVTQPTINDPYSFTFTAIGATAPVTWAITAGTLPNGLTLNASTGTISGTPTESGIFPYTIEATDSSAQPKTAQIDCTFVIDTAFSAIGTITIDHTKCGSSGNTLHWPFLFNSTDAAFKLVADGGYVTDSNGYDLVFFSDEALTVHLDFEIERYSSATGEFIAWVKIPSLSISVNTVIYIGIGNAEITTSQEDIHGTWDDGGSNYFKGVWHLKNGTVLSLVDSTINANNGTNTGLVAIEGQIDGAFENPGVVGASIPDSASLRMLRTDSMTWEFLWKSHDLATQQYPMFKTDLATTPGWVVRVEIAVDSNAPRLYLYGNLIGDFIFNAGEGLGGSPGINDDEWGLLQITYNGNSLSTGIRMIWRALPLTMTNPAGSLTNNPTSTSPMLLGYINHSQMDEIRISKGIVRSDDYATANWNNQFSPSTFYGLVIVPL